jgi:hypothetical protein
MFREYDVVKLKRTTSDIPLPEGARGTVLIVHDANPPAYEVEFMDGADSLGVYTASDADLEEDNNYNKDARKHR